MARRMPQTLTLTTALLGSIYVAIVRAHVAEQASQYGRSREGRN